MNNFQHASKSDVLTEDSIGESKVEESLESPQEAGPQTIALDFRGEAVVNGISRGIEVKVPQDEVDLDETSLFETHQFDSALLEDEPAEETNPGPEIFDAALFDGVVENAKSSTVALEDDIEFEASQPESPEKSVPEEEILLEENPEEDTASEEYEVDSSYEFDAVEAEEYPDAVDAVGEVMEVEVIDSEEHDRSYEVYQQGSLTYFRYYLDDEEEGAPYDHDAPISPKPFLSAGAMGVGVLAATFGVGLLVAETTNNRRTEVAAEGGADSEQRQVENKKEITSALKTDKATPETSSPDWSSTADKPFGKSITAKTGKENLLAAEPTETLASSADKVSGAATSLAAQVEVAQADAPPSSLPTWRASAASVPYIPPTTAASPSSYQVVPVKPLPPVALAQVSSVSTPVAAQSVDELRLAERIKALRESIPNTTAPPLTDVPIANLPSTASSALGNPGLEGSAASTAPTGSGTTRVTDPINPMEPIAEQDYQPPAASAVTVQTFPPSQAQAQVQDAAQEALEARSPVVATLLEAPPNAVSADTVQRLEERKRLLNQAIAQPVAGLLVVPVATATTPEEKQSSIPIEVVPSDLDLDSIQPDPLLPGDVLPEVISPANSAELPPPDVLALNDSPSVDSVSTSVSLISSLGELLTLAEQPNTAMLQPLASELAQEMRQGSEQLEQFRILALNNNDYEQLWRIASAQSGDSVGSLIAPAHGFVDYQRNVIALLTGEPSGLTQLQPELQRTSVQEIAQALTPMAGEL